ncbi:MAG: hypothetical protein ACRDKJ_01925 [Actinomycetota bacterium]
MPRRHRRRPEEGPREPRVPRTTTPIPTPEGWTAALYKGGESGHDYVCPRCQRQVARHGQHVVAWVTDSGERHRHWHTNCWQSAVREGLDRYRWS